MDDSKKIPLMGELKSATTEGFVGDSQEIRYEGTKSVKQKLDEIEGNVSIDEENSLLKVSTSDNKTYVARVELLSKPAAPTYGGSTSITTTAATATINLTNNESGASVVYTMTSDGSEPADPRTSQSAATGTAIQLSGILNATSKTFKIKAASKKNGEYSDTVLSVQITTYRQVQKPVISIVSGTTKFSTTRYVTISCGTSGATIHYTENGDAATEESATYSGQLTVTESESINAIAVKSGWADSASANEVYVEVGAPLIYYGVSSKSAMASMADVTSLPYNVGKDSPVGSYAISSSANGYIWFCVPNNMTINSVKASGFDVPLETATTTVSGYKCYRSSEEQKPLNDTFVVS